MVRKLQLSSILALALTSAMLFASCGDDTTAEGAASTTTAVENTDGEARDATATSVTPAGDTDSPDTDSPDADSPDQQSGTDVDAASDPDSTNNDASETNGSETDGSQTDGSEADDSDTGSSETDSPNAGDSQVDSSTSDTDSPGTEAAESDDTIEELQLLAAMAAVGIEPDSKAGKCMRENKDLILGTSSSGDSIYVAAKCAPVETAKAISASQTFGDLTADETACVMAEALSHMASLPDDEARAAFSQDRIPDEYVAVIVPLAAEKCGVDAERFAEDFAS